MNQVEQQIMAYSLITGDDLPVGEPSKDVEALLMLGNDYATSRPGVIVHLQKWKDVRD